MSRALVRRVTALRLARGTVAPPVPVDVQAIDVPAGPAVEWRPADAEDIEDAEIIELVARPVLAPPAAPTPPVAPAHVARMRRVTDAYAPEPAEPRPIIAIG